LRVHLGASAATQSNQSYRQAGASSFIHIKWLIEFVLPIDFRFWLTAAVQRRLVQRPLS
jgi:hypothetical protein